jgi:dipeptidyl aminopeptidase/acylaminoacyl peptidase
LSTQKLTDFKVLNNATPHQLKYDPAFSQDGKFIAFVSGQDHHRNIYMMNSDGTNVRQITRNYNENPKNLGNGLYEMIHNEKPSFSPDGKRIIFVRSATKPINPIYPGGPLDASRWDIFELEIATGKERKLTNYAFYRISPPQYLVDGKRFIFSAQIWAGSPMQETESGVSEATAYEHAYNFNTILVMDGENNELKSILKNGWRSNEPRVMSGDVILFQSKVNEKNNKLWTGQGVAISGTSSCYSPFIYKKGFLIDNITRVSNKCIKTLSTSPDRTIGLLLMWSGKMQIINAEGKLIKEIEVRVY